MVQAHSFGRALRVLFHRFQTVFDRIRLTFSVATGTKSLQHVKEKEKQHGGRCEKGIYMFYSFGSLQMVTYI